ncbi:MAG: DnaJ domain-containing protein [Alphaproteobacteria bacterium]|nr:DnaJ domain-containing protein [Alphaproteobacteria bacterium]
MQNTTAHYATLHLPPSASPEEVKRAYRALVKRYHPDRVPEKYKKPAEDKLREVVAAYAAIRKAALTKPALPSKRSAKAWRPATYDVRAVVRGMDVPNDNRPRRVAPFPWSVAAREGWSNLTEILWPIASGRGEDNRG